MAPGAWLVSLKVLGADGSGQTSDVIRAIDFAIAHKDEVRAAGDQPVAGPSGVRELRGRPAVPGRGARVSRRAGGGGLGGQLRQDAGRAEGDSAAITSPGNSPLCADGRRRLTATGRRSGPTTSSRTSAPRGPTLYDHLVKPDIAAPGRRLHSLYAPGSTLAKRFPEKLISGNGQNGLFELSGRAWRRPW